MAVKYRRREAGLVFKRGKATPVIQGIDVYQEFERLEDAEDLIMLIEERQESINFIMSDDFLEAMNCSLIIN